MKNARELLEGVFKESWRDAEGLSGAATFLHDTFPGLHLENLRILIDTPDQVFGEYEFTNVSTITSRTVHQLFFGRLVAENGRIKLLREAHNSAQTAQALLKQGISELLSRTDAAPAVTS